MAKFPGKIESANPKEFAIVNGDEIAGGRSVATVADLYKIPVAILSKSKGAVPTDAEGQRWYVVSEKKEYRLINFAQHATASGWKVVEEGGGKGAVESVNGKTGVVELEAADIVVSVDNGVKKSQAELNQETENSISYLSNSTLGKSIEVTGIKVRLNRAPYSDTEVLIPVQKGLECGLLTPAMAQTILDNEDSLVALQEQVDGIIAKKDGATFTPSVAPNGDLSWTNDQGKPNPATVNLMGKPGAPGAKGDKGDQGNTGCSVDYPFELVNNLTEGGVEKALTAEQGKALNSILSQHTASIDELQQNAFILEPVDHFGKTSGYMNNKGEVIYGTSTINKYHTSEDDILFISSRCPLSTGATPKWCSIWFTDDKGLMISGIPVDTTGMQFDKYKIVVPKSATQIWIYESPETIVLLKKTALNTVEKLEKRVNVIEEEVSQQIGFKTEMEVASVKRDYLMKDDGTLQYNSNAQINQYDVTGGKVVSVTTNTTLSAGAAPKWCVIWQVDSDGKMLLSYTVDILGQDVKDYEFKIAQNAAQIWITASKNTKAFFLKSVTDQVKENTDKLNAAFADTNQWKGKKIVWLGTSIPYGQTSEGGGITNPMQSPYPKQIAKLLQCTVENNALPGMAIETTEDFKRKQFGSLTLTKKELEEQGYSTAGNVTFENALLGKNADLYVFDCEPNNLVYDKTILDNFDLNSWKYKDDSTFESHRANYIGALIFLLDKLWTEKPDAKVVLVGEFGYTDWKIGTEYIIREASIAFSKKFNLPYIDLFPELGYTAKNKSVYINDDWVHPKYAAHIRMAKKLSHKLLFIA